jgi:Zn finger protein HypA/HybF involved in hydrogenase expression
MLSDFDSVSNYETWCHKCDNGYNEHLHTICPTCKKNKIGINQNIDEYLDSLVKTYGGKNGKRKQRKK